MDATIIAAPSSTKNADKARDPDMHQTRKGQQWYFGMKLHIGVDSQRAGAQRRGDGGQRTTNTHCPICCMAMSDVYGDSAYASQKTLIASKAPGQGLHQPAHPPCGRGGRSSAGQEPQQVTGARSGRACLCGGKAPVGIHSRCAIAGCKRTPRVRSRPWRWPTSTLPEGACRDRCACGSERGSKAPETGPVGQSTVSCGPFGIKWLCDGYDVTCSALP
ncbi:hypothetical protein [Klebsiella pneumoniae]|uniref:hypothetical protein n=1 Tax=Klebsiella pneumoniae TaxID=573 RepID=UPI0039751B16